MSNTANMIDVDHLSIQFNLGNVKVNNLNNYFRRYYYSLSGEWSSLGTTVVNPWKSYGCMHIRRRIRSLNGRESLRSRCCGKGNHIRWGKYGRETLFP